MTTSEERSENAAVLATWLVRLSRRVEGVFAQASGHHGLTATQARVLCILVEQPRGMSELAGILNVEKAGITGLVDRVERRGLVERTAMPGDRRATHVRLTAAGRQAAVGVHNEVCARLDGLASELPPAERECLRHSLARMLSGNERS
jgi:DNA-binding MarR family transcriptional regulator